MNTAIPTLNIIFVNVFYLLVFPLFLLKLLTVISFEIFLSEKFEIMSQTREICQKP